jgi:hypothetical protein
MDTTTLTHPDARPSLRSLEDFDAQQRPVHERLAAAESQQAAPNGIACPACGKECWESITQQQMLRAWARKVIYCRTCDWVGRRLL